MGFDNYVKANFKNLTGSTKVFMKEAYEAGAQSRQAEIDELQTMYEKQGLYAFELQKRIDEALHAADESCGVSVAAFVKLNRILKGND